MRASKNQWAISPETIMSHHFRLAKGIPHVVDTTPPRSMFNSPISIHYLPKRSSSADPFKRKSLSKSQRELNDFVHGRNGDPHSLLRLPLPIRSSLTDLVKPKLLDNRNYQPPRRKAPSKERREMEREEQQSREKMQRIKEFRDAVLDELMENPSNSDQMIMSCIEIHMESFAGLIPWNDLEEASHKLMLDIGVDLSKTKSRRNSKRSHKPPRPFRVEPIASPKSLESLSSPSSSSSKTSSSSSSSGTGSTTSSSS
ncbi:hypothetical protein CRE_19712 [Caenorhabditis remanei]|uniref:Uncharacterized protein n=2 Tax=Caenorhabditis remanei TaxID=31234 RepID=E3MD91_CAERE|nr:hypothetical protein CRE_19712 [Caenorhabditis remanei]